MARSRKTQPTFIGPPTHHLHAVLLGTGLLLVIATAIFFDTYEQRIFPGVRVGNVSVGSLTQSEAIQRLATELAERRVTLVHDQYSWEPTYAELGVVFDLVPPVSQAYSLGRWAPLDQWFQTWTFGRTVPLNYTWTTDGLEAYLGKVIDDIGQPPINPEVTFTNGTFVVSREQSGLVIDGESVQAQLRPAVLLGRSASLTLDPRVQWPPVDAQDYSDAITQATSLISQPLELRVGDQIYPIDPSTLASWFDFEVVGENRVSLAVDQSAVGAYLLTLAKDINRDPQPQQVLVSQNKVEVIKPGEPGRALAISGAVERVVAAVMSVNTTSLELPMNDVPPNTDYAAIPPAPIASGKVISVDLTKQHEYVYQDNVLVYSSKISSGINDWTPTGNFKVYAKTKKQKMSGPDYYVPNVPDILWFKGDYSLHGVYWHNDFGIRPRSHGCVGQPLDTAAWLFDWAEVGTPVVIYKS